MTSYAWLFDVDGTLTPSSGQMQADFSDWFLRFAQQQPVYIVTGGSYERMRYQLGDELLDTVRACWCCLGNSRWEGHEEVSRNEFTLPEDARLFLQQALERSAYPLRTGLHFEPRQGLVNFSIVGRNANGAERQHYFEWDRRAEERIALLEAFRARFPALDAQLGGETSCDIFARGFDKSQVLTLLPGPVQFFGDQMGPWGVDRPVSLALQRRADGSRVHEVRSWEHTACVLRGLVASNSERAPLEALSS